MSHPPRPATDATTMADALAQFETEGYRAQMSAREGGLVLCLTCREETPAGEVSLQGLIRTEGASDPDDMTAVAALVCPRCDAHGTVVLHYGPSATPEESDVLRELEDERGETGVSAGEPTVAH